MKHYFYLALMCFALTSAHVYSNEPKAISDTGTPDAHLVDLFPFKSMADQDRALDLSKKLRCPRCQNQNLTESNAPIARDMRLKVYQLVDAGKSDQEILDYMTERFGEFVLYKPKLNTGTYVLWFTPVVLLLLILIYFMGKVRQAKPR